MLWCRKSPALRPLSGKAWFCATCGGEHQGMPDLAAHSPDLWTGSEEYEPNGALRLDGNFLSEDFCVLDGEHFFVRSVLFIPVRGMDQDFGFGCWSTLSRANFEKYVAAFDTGHSDDEGSWWGWFSNRLKGFEDTLNQGCWVHPRAGRQRPTITLDDETHELAIAQRDGIPPERVLALYAANGHSVG